MRAGFCYKFSESSLQWDEARAFCKAQKADLASVRDMAEYNWLKGQVTKDPRKNEYWLGMTDKEKEGTWKWVDGTKWSTAVATAAWGKGQPDNYNDNEDCGEFWDSPNGVWNDEPCENWKRFICKRRNNVLDLCDLDDGWHPHLDKCYKQFGDMKEWGEAEEVCESYNGNLMVINTQDKLHLTWDTLTCYDSKARYWIGLSDTVLPNYMTWVDGSPLSLDNWDEDQPQYPEPGNMCTEIVSGARHKWRAAYCNQERMYVCEKPQGSCPQGWQRNGDTCFQVNALPDARRTWTEAHKFCTAEGANLLDDLNKGKHNFVKKIMKQLKNGKIDSSWLGLSDRDHDNKITWWDNTELLFNQWAKGHPKRVDKRMDCGFIPSNDKNSRWRTGYCFTKRPFVCQQKIFKMIYNVTEPDACKETHLGTDYVGTISTTRGGKTCQRWDSQSPHKHSIGSTDAEFLLDGGLKNANNYCRNPDGESDGPWCYTTTSSVRWEYCDIPFCHDKYVCSPGWQMFEEFCYLFVEPIKNWHAANDDCKTQSAYLTSITNPGEQSFISGKVTGRSWIGLHDIGTEGNFEWSDGSQYNFTNWNKGEPNSFYPEEDCAEILGPGSLPGVWNDERCNFKNKSYICKKPATHRLLPPPTTMRTTQPAWSEQCGPYWSFDSLGNYCYQLFTDVRKDWPSARQDCLSKGGDLVSIVGVHEQAYISAMIISSAGHGSLSFWTGGNDRDQRGGWRWSDGSPFRFVLWSQGEPRRKHCVSITAIDGRWKAQDCPTNQAYMCKKLPAGVTTVATTLPTTPAPPDCQHWPMISGFQSIQDDLLASSSNKDSKHQAKHGRLDLIGCKDDNIGKAYQGFAAWTISGRTCMKWADQYPHKHRYTDPSMFPDATMDDVSNNCRNPDGRKEGPWCLTTDPKKRWERCWIPDCKARTPYSGTWDAKNNKKGEWLEVDFKVLIVVKGIVFGGSQEKNQFVKIYRISYGFDHSQIEWYQDENGAIKDLTGLSSPNEISVQMFDRHFQARYVRIWPRSWQNGISVRWDLLGCKLRDCGSEELVTGPSIVPDERITSSSDFDAYHSSNRARMHTLKEGPNKGGWAAKNNDVNQWIQAEFSRPMRVRVIATQGRSDVDQWVTRYMLEYSYRTDSNFQMYQQPYGFRKEFNGNKDRNTVKKNWMKSPFMATRIRIRPLAWNNHVAMRFDVLGCEEGCRGWRLIKNVPFKRITASSEFDSNHGVTRCKLDTKRKGPLRGGWSAKSNDGQQWIMVTLVTQFQVKAVGTQGRSDVDQWTTEYNIYYSTDGNNFQVYSDDNKTPTKFPGNWDRNRLRKHYFKSPFVAKYVRLWPTQWNKHTSLRWELYGCAANSLGTPIGCFNDKSNDRDLSEEPLVGIDGMSARLCVRHCSSFGYGYAGVQRGTDCYCGNSYGKYGPNNKCNVPCSSEPETNCGGRFVNFIYGTGLKVRDERCRPSWMEVKGQCYHVMDDEITWFDGQKQCRAMGGDLATINDQQANDAITSYLGLIRKDVWIGLNEINFKGQYDWSDSSPVTFTNWNTNEPNDNKGQNEQCVAVKYKNGRWYDAMCGGRFKRSLCQMSKEVIPTPSSLPGHEDCQPGYIAYGYSCYSFIGKNGWIYKWAQRRCSDLGGTLVRINDRYESAFLASQLASMDSKVEFWTDANDIETKGTYVWSNGHSYLPYTHWAPGQPDDTDGANCVTLGAATNAALWYDRKCDSRRGYICEMMRRGYTSPALPEPTDISGSCSLGWIQSGSNCYQVNQRSITFQLKWTDARENCQQQGGDLASFHNKTEHDTLFKYAIAGEADQHFWIGLNNRDSNQGHVWSDGSPVQYTNWAPNEPNNMNNRENCVEMKWTDGKWNDENCGGKRNWICMLPVGTDPISLVTTPAPSAGPPGSCSPDNDDWKLYGGSCYYVSKGGDGETMTWRKAEQFCNKNQAYLASIHTAEEQAFVAGQVRANDVGTFGRMWIGLNELDQGKGYQWSDGSALQYTNWADNEPNDQDRTELCVDMWIADGKWNDEHCTVLLPFVCKKLPGGATIPPPTNPPPMSGNCPAGYKTFRNKCFKLYGRDPSERKNFAEAQAFCNAQGLTYGLASIRNRMDQAFITSQLVDMPIAAWIGMKYRGWGQNGGEFIWLDNSEVRFTWWDVGEPNGKGQEACVEVKDESFHAGFWNDLNCDARQGWICMTYKQATILTPEPPPPNNCPLNFEPWGNGCYHVSTGKRNWDESDAYCKGLAPGAQLASTTSLYEHAYLFTLINRWGQRGNAWIGLNDKMVTGQYVWTDNWPVVFTFWGKNEPQDTGRCIMMRNRNSRWKAKPCTNNFGAVCKVTTEKPPYIPPPPDGSCPDDETNSQWFSFRGNCYLFKQTESKNFAEADFECHQLGAKLVTIHSQDESVFLNAHMLHVSSQNVWIGMFRSINDGFQWKDNSPVQYTNWANGEPSDVNGTEEENCVEAYALNGKWNDNICTAKRGYVCMRESVMVSPGTPPYTGIYTRPTGKQTTTKNIPRFTTPKPWTWAPTTTRGFIWTFTWTPPMGVSTPLPRKQAPSINGGGIAGIVIAVLVVLVVIVLIVLYMRRRNAKGSAPHESFDNPAYSANTDRVQVAGDWMASPQTNA
ncbi:unnamed protein product [Owenia fusiformis]|uniref:Macrophage mannose receptor 1-like n=1 Tax=Owenia fusiformis TaxID=6347 RepID=A0A8S4NIG0_OWEFU|nr:unnamed protein product [Owenia fusiformis]